MACGSIDVTYGAEDLTRLPDAMAEGAALLLGLRQRGVLDNVGERLRIRRQGGFCGLDVFVALWLYYASDRSSGFKGFWQRCAQHHAAQLGAVAGRDRLMSPSSVSRALDAVEVDLLRPVADTLLHTVANVDTVLRHPAVQSYDALGEGWHVFDVDPTVSALRHRALPQSDDLPDPVRRSKDLGAPGYKGRKRGDIVLRRATVMHAGAAVWTHAHLAPGNGDALLDFAACLDSIVATCDRLGHPCSRALVRMDGEHGNLPWFAACRERGLPFVTRLNRNHLLQDPQILEALRAARWAHVPDSQCGPQRSAADVGLLTLKAGAKTRRPDGTRYAPLQVRVVACIFPKTGAAKRGRVLDGHEVELFAVDLPVDGWPAHEAIAAYYGRNALENRFAQEDRELGLDRILSYHLPGQELATLVALALWNERVVRGFELQPPPDEPPLHGPRRPVEAPILPEGWPRDPVLAPLLDALDWDKLLAKRPGWSYDRGVLVCDEGRPLTLTTVRPTPSSPSVTSVIFRRPSGGCEDCGSRSGCLHSDRPAASKHLELSIPTAVAEALRARLAQLRRRPKRQVIEPIAATPGPRAVQSSLFLPARARQAFRALFDRVSLHVHVELEPAPRPHLTLVANDDADRQRRRRSWDQNLARHALPHDARLHIRVAGASRILCDTLGYGVSPKEQSAGA